MLTFLFWNLHSRKLAALVAEAAHEQGVDVVVLAECKDSIAEMLVALNQSVDQQYTCPPNLSDRLSFFVRFPSSTFRSLADLPGIAIRSLQLPGQDEITIIGAHLGSKLYDTDAEQDFELARIADEIRLQERARGHSRTLVLGDLNMHPFQTGLVAAKGLHAIMDRRIVLRRTHRAVKKQDYPLFYNPMWSHFGDGKAGPPGTYYRSHSGQVCHFWYMFDQILLRPDLIPLFDDRSLQILTSVGGRSLLKPNGTPDTSVGSDHLPVRFTLRF